MIQGLLLGEEVLEALGSHLENIDPSLPRLGAVARLVISKTAHVP